MTMRKVRLKALNRENTFLMLTLVIQKVTFCFIEKRN